MRLLQSEKLTKELILMIDNFPRKKMYKDAQKKSPAKPLKKRFAGLFNIF